MEGTPDEVKEFIEVSDDHYRDDKNPDSSEIVTPAILNPKETEISASITTSTLSEFDLLSGDYYDNPKLGLYWT